MIVLTADHGVCGTSRTYYLKDYPEILNNLTLPPVGDSRATFLTAKQGRSENLKSAFEKSVEGFRIVPSKELINLEAFGRTTDSTLLQATVGDLTALSTGANAMAYPFFEEDRNREQRGGHGGMTAEEVIVPLLSLNLTKV